VSAVPGGRPSLDLLESSQPQTTAVPRHNEIVEPTAARICKDLGVPKSGA